MHNSSPTHAIPVICLEGQIEVWENIQAAVKGHRGFQMVKAPASISSLCDIARSLGPSVLITDKSFLAQHSAAYIRRLCGSGPIHILVFVDPVDQDGSLEQYLRVGCAGVLHRTDSPEVCRRAMQATAAGELWMPRRLLSKLARAAIHAADPPPKLTPRESEILNLIGSGLTNREVADHLCISTETVRWHLRSLYVKLGVADRQSARKWAHLAADSVG